MKRLGKIKNRWKTPRQLKMLRKTTLKHQYEAIKQTKLLREKQEDLMVMGLKWYNARWIQNWLSEEQAS